MAYSDLAHHIIGRNPKTWGVIFVAMIVVMVILLILWIVYLNKYKDCESGGKNTFLGTDPLGNLNTGGNNPMWNLQMGNAGWGGSMQSTYQPGEARVWGASAEGGHAMAVAPHLSQGCGTPVSPAAVGEAQVLTAVQAYEPAASAKAMSDDALMRVMNGGSMSAY